MIQTNQNRPMPVNSTGSQALGSSSPGRAEAADAALVVATPRQVREWLLAGEAVLVDVREPDEHAREQIIGARLMPLSKFDAAMVVDSVKPGQRLVMHCRGGTRSADAARMAASLTSAGVPVVSMSGGIEAWKQDGLPTQVNRGVARVSVMRQVQMVIGAGVLCGAGLAWFVHPGFMAIPAFFGAGLTFAGASGTCALAMLIGKMPWNRVGGKSTTGSCSSGGCV